jgi:hypothetical protein
MIGTIDEAQDFPDAIRSIAKAQNDAEPYVPISYFLLSIRFESYPKRPLDGRCEARELRGVESASDGNATSLCYGVSDGATRALRRHECRISDSRSAQSLDDSSSNWRYATETSSRVGYSEERLVELSCW